MAAPTTDGPEAGGREAKGWTVPRVAAAVVAVLLILFWIWIFAGGPRKQNPDYLGDRAWVERAESTCAATLDRIDALTPASQSPDAADRATVVDQGTDELQAMVDRLGSPLPTGSGDAEVTRKWLADYGTYIGDRRAYAKALRRDPNAKLLVDEKYHDPLDTVLETFAKVNDMPSCAPPGDVA